MIFTMRYESQVCTRMHDVWGTGAPVRRPALMAFESGIPLHRQKRDWPITWQNPSRDMGGPAFHLQRKPRIEFQEENQGRHWPIRAILNRPEVGGGVEGEGSEFFLGGLVSARNPCAFFPARPLCPWAIEYATPPAS